MNGHIKKSGATLSAVGLVGFLGEASLIPDFAGPWTYILIYWGVDQALHIIPSLKAKLKV